MKTPLNMEHVKPLLELADGWRKTAAIIRGEAPRLGYSDRARYLEAASTAESCATKLEETLSVLTSPHTLDTTSHAVETQPS